MARTRIGHLTVPTHTSCSKYRFAIINQLRYFDTKDGVHSRGYERNNLFTFPLLGEILYTSYIFIFYIFLRTPKRDILFIYPAGHPEKGYFIY